jgi:hypothetical protein
MTSKRYARRRALRRRETKPRCRPGSSAVCLHLTAHMSLPSHSADFILTSHHQCRLQKRRRSAAAAAVPRATPRRRTASRSQQQPRCSFLHSAACTSRQRLQHAGRIPEQRIVSLVSAAATAVAYALIALQPRPTIQLSVTRTSVLLQGQPLLRDPRTRLGQHCSGRYVAHDALTRPALNHSSLAEPPPKLHAEPHTQ